MIYLSTGVLDTAFDSQVYQLLRHLIVTDVSVHHFSLEPFAHWNKNERVEKTRDVSGQIPCQPIRMFPFWGNLSLRADARLLRVALSKLGEHAFGVIHTRGYINGYRALMAIDKQRDKFRLITDYRGTLTDEITHYQASGVRKFVDRYRFGHIEDIERRMLIDSDVVSCVSHSFIGWLERKYEMTVKRSVVIPSIVNTYNFQFDADIREQTRMQLNLNDKLICVYLGGLAPWQNPVETAQLFMRIKAKCEDAHLLFVTSDPGRAEMILDNLVPKRFRTVLRVPHDQVPDYLCAADIAFLLRDNSPTNLVASPIKFSEYLCCGLPVIVTSGIGDTELYLDEFDAGVVLPDLLATPADIMSVVKDNNDRQLLAHRAAQRFGLDGNIARLMADVYKMKS